MVSAGRQRLVSVIGAGSASEPVLALAREAGGILARRGWGVVCGGAGGVMAAACQGALAEGGLTVGILPGTDAEAANPYCRVVIPSGLGQARNVLVVQAGLGALAICGGAGTLSEIGHALKMGKPVVGLDTWDIKGVLPARNPQEAVDLLLARINSRPARP